MKLMHVVLVLVTGSTLAAGLSPLDQLVPADEHHLNSGKSQTETTIVLAPGRHRPQLLLADQLHIPHEPAVMWEPVTITVRQD